ncbi:MAG: DMT family transporter [Eubacterium sp.]|nr:DMT family transporter [Eubacterium sp.]
MEKLFKKTYFLWLAAGLCCLLWGSAFPAIKAGYSLFEIPSGDTASIILFAGIRFFLAGVLTLIIFSVIGRKPLIPQKSSFKRIAVLALFQTVLQYVFFYLGLAFTSGSRGSVINASSVFFAMLLSGVVFKMERLKLNKIIGSIIGFSGVVLISLDAFNSTGGGIKGELFILISSVSYAFSSVFIKRFSEYDNPAMLSGCQFLLGGAALTLFGLAFGGRLTEVSLKGITLLVYLALVSAVAYSLWSLLLKYNDVSRVAVCGFMIPVFGFFLSALFEKTEIGIVSVISLILAVSGIITVNIKNNKTEI